jgi:hypothetical protein
LLLAVTATGFTAGAAAFAVADCTGTTAGFAVTFAVVWAAGTTFAVVAGDGFEFTATVLFLSVAAFCAGFSTTVGVCAKAATDIANHIEIASVRFIRPCLLLSLELSASCHG